MQRSINRKTWLMIALALLLTAMLAACGGGGDQKAGKKDETKKEETKKEEHPGGKKDDQEDGKTGASEDGKDASDDGKKADGKLGFRNVHYKVLNPDWTDTDHLALIDTESWNYGRGVFVLDFGPGSNIVKEAGIRDVDQNNCYGVFGSVFQNTGDLFYLTYVSGDELELVIARPDAWVTVRMKSDDEMYYDQETSQVVPSANGHYDIVLPKDEYNSGQEFWALIYPTNGSFPLAVKLSGVGTLEKAEGYLAYIEEHTGNYRLKEKYDLTTAQDKDGNAVELTSYAFYTDLLSLDVAERFGINFREAGNIERTNRNIVAIEGSDKNWRDVQFTSYVSLSEEDQPVDFMGYEMYYLSNRYLYLKYGEKQYIKFDIRHKIDSEQERKAWLEQEYFSNYGIED